VTTVLSLPIGSADAERAFSILNHIRTKRRSSLTGKTINNLMRIRMNGPRKLEKFSALKYAKKWIEADHMRTDDPSQNKKRRIDLPVDGDEEMDKGENKYMSGQSTLL
jgi:hypothetical protein